MKMTLARSIALAFTLAGAVSTACAQTAAKWPTQPVRFIVPFPAGSAPDVLIRQVGIKLTDSVRNQTTDVNFPGLVPAPEDIE